MQTRLCPKCGMENKPDKASCSGCYASLEGVAPTEAKEKPAPSQTQPAAQQPLAAQPLSSSGSAVPGAGPPPPNYAAPPGAPSSYGPTFNERRPPIKQGPNWGAIILVILLLAGAAFGGWWFFLKPASPAAVVQKYIDANTAGDYDAVKACLRQDEVAVLGKRLGGEQAARERMKQGAGRNMGGDVLKTTYENSGSLAVVEVKPKDQSSMPPGITTVEVLLVNEDGKWKVDLKATAMRAIKKVFPNGVPGMRRPAK